MNNLLNFEAAYMESVPHRYEGTRAVAHHQMVDDRLNNSRQVLESLSDEGLIEFWEHLKNGMEFDEDRPENLETIEGILWDMLIVDPDRAFSFYAKVLDNPSEHFDIAQPLAVALDLATYVRPLDSIKLWNLAYEHPSKEVCDTADESLSELLGRDIIDIEPEVISQILEVSRRIV